MYDMKSIFTKIDELVKGENRETNLSILLSSIDNSFNSDFYKQCNKNFENIVNIYSKNNDYLFKKST